MTATINLNDEEIKDLRDLTQASDLAGALRRAIDECRRYARRMRLKELSGQIAMDDNWRALEAAETDAEIYSTDPHFDFIGELKRFTLPQ